MRLPFGNTARTISPPPSKSEMVIHLSSGLGNVSISWSGHQTFLTESSPSLSLSEGWRKDSGSQERAAAHSRGVWVSGTSQGRLSWRHCLKSHMSRKETCIGRSCRERLLEQLARVALADPHRWSSFIPPHLLWPYCHPNKPYQCVSLSHRTVPPSLKTESRKCHTGRHVKERL